MGKNRKREGSIEEFDAAARARGLTYAQAQVEETCRIFCRRKQIPDWYRHVGKNKHAKEV